MRLQPRIDRTLCIGAGNCVGVAPDLFALDEDGIAIVIGGSDEEALLRDAAWSCPTDAISLFDEEGNQLFPQSTEYRN